MGLHTINEGSWGPQARLDSKTRELLINSAHPWYDSPEITAKQLMEAKVLLGSCFGIGEGVYLENNGSREYVAGFNGLCAKLLFQDSQASAIDERADSKFVESKIARSYTYSELHKVPGLNTTILSKLIRAGFLNPKDKIFSGEEVERYFQKLLDCRPAGEVMQQLAEEKGVTKERRRQMCESVDIWLSNFGDRLPFVWNIGIKEPFYLVSNENAQLLKGLYLQGALTKGAAEYSQVGSRYRGIIEQAVRESGNSKLPEFVGLEVLCNIIRGQPKDVFKIIGYAQRAGAAIASKFEGQRTYYSVANFRKAREKFLEDNI